jgi:hypothetical protein
MLVNPPRAAAPSERRSRPGPRAAASNDPWLGAWSTAVTALSPPAIPHDSALTRDTGIPHSRAASWFEAAARIALPQTDHRRKAARAATVAGTSRRIRMCWPPRMNEPRSISVSNGTGNPSRYSAVLLGPRLGTYVSASSSWATPMVTSSSETPWRLRRSMRRITSRSMSIPVATPTAITVGNATHQLHPSSRTKRPSRSADTAPSWAWARLMNRLAR